MLIDFYGTVAEDDDTVVDAICRRVSGDTGAPVSTVADLWWQAFCGLCSGSHGKSFRLQSVLARDSLATVLAAFGSGLDAAELVAPQLAHWSAPPPYEDALRFLDAVKLPVVLLSDIDTGHLEAALRSLGLSEVPRVTSEQVRAYKPRPEGFLSGLAQLGLPPYQVVHVGNSWSSDVRGAVAAGIRPVWVNRTGRARPDAKDARVLEVPDLDALAPRFRRPTD